MSKNPFAPMGAAKTVKPKTKAALENVVPVPTDAPKPAAAHNKLGEPSATWDYHDDQGRMLGCVLRFDPASGKEFRQLTLWRNTETSILEWRWESWPAPRPLFGLDDLASKPSAPVIITEGEKAAEAAKRLLPAYAAITSPGGALAAGKADWSPLKGRQVVLWPDADSPGRKYAEAVAAACLAAGAASVAIVDPPQNVSEGWDLADAEIEKWTQRQVEKLIGAAVPVENGTKESAEKAKTKPRRQRPRARDTLNNLVEACDFWHGPDGTAYVTFPVKDHFERSKIRSDRFRRWLTGRAYEENGAVPGAQALEDGIRFFEGRATQDGPEITPGLRVLGKNGELFIDLCDAKWRVLRVWREGWELLENHDVPFLRTPAMLSLPVPVTGSKIDSLRPFVNVASEAEFRLVVAWLIATLFHRGEYPVLIASSEQGSGKSTLFKNLRSLVDPNVAPIRAPPQTEEDVIIAAKNGHCVIYDNMSAMPAALADWLCRLSTGGGFSARVKFTNDEEHVVYVCSPIALNGIPSLADRPDLARRALLVHLKPIPEEARRPDDELAAAWEEARPRILGALLDGLSAAIDNLPYTRLERYGSMPFFEKLIEAASPGLGWEPGSFSRIYAENRLDLDGASYEANPVALTIGDLIQNHYPNGWSGTATRLLELLCERVTEAVKRSNVWPKTAQGLGNQLERVKPLLRPRGIIIERRHSGERTITIAPKIEGGVL